jgi:hypothetical protein
MRDRHTNTGGVGSQAAQSDADQRIALDGPADEVKQFADTFDLTSARQRAAVERIRTRSGLDPFQRLTSSDFGADNVTALLMTKAAQPRKSAIGLRGRESGPLSARSAPPGIHQRRHDLGFRSPPPRPRPRDGPNATVLLLRRRITANPDHRQTYRSPMLPPRPSDESGQAKAAKAAESRCCRPAKRLPTLDAEPLDESAALANPAYIERCRRPARSLAVRSTKPALRRRANQMRRRPPSERERERELPGEDRVWAEPLSRPASYRRRIPNARRPLGLTRPGSPGRPRSTRLGPPGPAHPDRGPPGPGSTRPRIHPAQDPPGSAHPPAGSNPDHPQPSSPLGAHLNSPGATHPGATHPGTAHPEASRVDARART